jgi:hypothetical protein
VANFAYQVTNFAYQGAGKFAYQGSTDAVSTPPGVKHHRPPVIRFREFEKREDIAAFLKAQLKLRHPASAFEIEVEPALVESQREARAEREAEMRANAQQAERESLILREKERTRRITDTNNAILSILLASYEDDES